MKRSSAGLMQIAIVLLGLAALSFLLGEPHFEGRNAHATLTEIYFNDPFLAFVYVGSSTFFYALYRAFRLFGQVRQTGAFSVASVTALRVIQRCAYVMLGFVAVGAVVILRMGDGEDRPAGLFMSLLAAGATGTWAFAAAQFARRLQTALRTSGAGRR